MSDDHALTFQESTPRADKLSNENCRICLDIGMNPLISPCSCLGSTKFVHEVCLKTWIRTKYRNISGAECEICKYKYNMIIKRDKTCDPIKAIPRQFSSCYFIPICVFFVIAMAVVTGVVVRDRLDFERKKLYSGLVLAGCLAAILLGLGILAKAIYKVLVIMQIREWRIQPFTGRKESIDAFKDTVESK
jgi:hypothetical protein